MSKLMISTALAGLLISAGAALAQPPDRGNRDGQHEQRGDRGDRGNRGDRGGDRRGQAQPQVQAQTQPAPQTQQPNRNGGFLNYGPMTGITPQNSQQQNDRDRRGDNRTEQRAPAVESPRNGFRDSDRDRRDFNRDGRDRDGRDFNRGGFDRGGRDFNRNDFQRFNRNFSAPRRFRAPAYTRPYGWYSRRWVFGEILPSLFWTSNYWINDWSYYGLEPPPPGTVWVRDGTDALLIDRFDGQIIQVVYDVFY